MSTTTQMTVLSKEQTKLGHCVLRAWRNPNFRKTVDIAKSFLGLLSLDNVKDMRYKEDLNPHLVNSTTVHALKDCVKRILLLVSSLYFDEGALRFEETIHIKRILPAYLIVIHPDKVFQRIDEIEKSLIKSSKTLIESMESICTAIISSEKKTVWEIPRDLVETFQAILCSYLQIFKDWKDPDEAMLMERIKNALIALHRAKVQMPTDEPTDSDLSVQFRVQIEKLKRMFTQIRTPEEYNAFEQEKLRPELFQVTVSRTFDHAVARRERGADISVDEITHTLLLDPNFRFTDSCTLPCGNGPHSAESTQMMLDDYWRELKIEMSIVPPSHTRVTRIFEYINMVLRQASTDRHRTMVDTHLDLEELPQKLSDGRGMKQLIDSLSELARNFQFPHRAAEFEVKWKDVHDKLAESTEYSIVNAFCDALYFFARIFTIELRIDLCNLRFELASSIIERDGVAHEQRKFQEKLEDGTLTTDRLKKWITETLENNHGTWDDEELVCFTGIMSIVTDSEKIRKSKCPETLLLDFWNLSHAQGSLEYAVWAATFLKMTEDIPTDNWTDFHPTISSLLLEKFEDNEYKVAQIVLPILRENLSLNLITSETMGRLVYAIEQSGNRSNAVHMHTRAYFINTFKSIASEGEWPNVQEHMKKAMGFYGKIEEVGKMMSRVVKVNLAVHFPRYSEIIKEELYRLRA